MFNRKAKEISTDGCLSIAAKMLALGVPCVSIGSCKDTGLFICNKQWLGNLLRQNESGNTETMFDGRQVVRVDNSKLILVTLSGLSISKGCVNEIKGVPNFKIYYPVLGVSKRSLIVGSPQKRFIMGKAILDFSKATVGLDISTKDIKQFERYIVNCFETIKNM